MSTPKKDVYGSKQINLNDLKRRIKLEYKNNRYYSAYTLYELYKKIGGKLPQSYFNK